MQLKSPRSGEKKRPALSIIFTYNTLTKLRFYHAEYPKYSATTEATSFR